LAALLLTLLLALGPAPSLADGGGGGEIASGQPRDPHYEQARRLIDQSRFEQALPLLQQVVAKNPRDANAYNLLGFSSRKLGRLDEALEFYTRALKIDPGHRGAHEYLGELYLQMGRLDKAKSELAFLDGDCWLPCEEYSDLKAAVAAYEARGGTAAKP